VKFALLSKRGIRETDHFKEDLICLGVPRTRDLVPPLGAILLLGRRHPFLLSPSATATRGRGHGEAIWVCQDCNHLTSVSFCFPYDPNIGPSSRR
jgi:hypothetical protein